MARNGSGTYNLPAGNPVTTGTTISSTWANSTLSDMATALTGSLAADGQTTPSSNLPMGTFAHTNVGNATVRNMYASAGQVQDGGLTYLTSVSGTNTITAVGAVGMTAYATGQKFTFVSAGANTGAATININSIGAKALTKNGATALSAGDIPSGAAVEVVYDGTQFQVVSAMPVTVTGDVVGPASATDNAVVRFDATTGKLIQNSVVTIADTTGNMTGVGDLTTTGNTTLGGLVGIGNTSMGSFNTNYNNLVVGSGSGSEGLTIYAGSANSAYIGLKSAANTSFQGGWEYDFATNDLYTYINGTARMQNTSTGALITNNSATNTNSLDVRATSTSYTNSVLQLGCDRATTNSSYNMIQATRYGDATCFIVRDSGNVENVNNSYGAISDIKLKENIVDATPKLDKLNQVRIVNYNLKNNPEHKQIGVIAQELELLFPSMIEEVKDRDEDGNELDETTKSVKYSVFVPILIKAIQELNAKFEEYKASHP